MKIHFNILAIVISVAFASPRSKLENLKSLYEKGLIKESEYETFRVSILKESFIDEFVDDSDPKLVWSDEFDTLDFTKWKHEITMGGGGNWEFEYYANNRSTSYVNDGMLHIKPLLTADVRVFCLQPFLGNENTQTTTLKPQSQAMGEAAMLNGGDLDLWGGTPADSCTSNAFYGCERTYL